MTHGMIRRAMIGAYMLILALGSGTALAQPIDFEAGSPETLSISATIENTITAAVIAPAMTPWGVIRSSIPGERARLEIAPGGVQNGVNNGNARAVQGGIGIPGAFQVSGAFPNTPVNVTFSNPVDLVCTACSMANPVLELIEITAELTPPFVGASGVDAVLDDLIPANNVVGHAFTTPTGDMTFYIGVALQTTVGMEPYETGTYAGTFDALLEY